MPYVTNTEKNSTKAHKCAKPRIKGSYGRHISVPNGTIWECEECHTYWRAKKRGYTYQSPWIKVYPWNFLSYIKIIKHELDQRKDRKNAGNNSEEG